MNLSRIFIERPIMTTLVMAALVIFGLFGYFTLPVSDLPNVDFPTISVSAQLPGADPVTMASGVAGPLENSFSTIPGIDQMSSNSSIGSTNITIQFALDRNIDLAAQDVQAAISAALGQLPKALPRPPSFRKVNPNDQPIMYIIMRSDTMALNDLDEYAETLLARQISTIEGVAQIQVFGQGKYGVRIQADPDALAARQIGIDQLADAVAAANVNQATGAINGVRQAASILATGQLNNAADFRNQVIAYRNGAPVRLSEVATVIDGQESGLGGTWLHQKKVVMLQVNRQPGSNTVEVIDKIKAILPRFEAGLPKAVQLIVLYDQSAEIRASVNDVQITLLIAGLMVVAVIFVFLRRVSATLIPSLALPIAVIATFAGMAAMRYNLDNLSLMALTLSVGFVVDDAIVMLENIVRHIEHGEKPMEAALKGSGEIGFTILSMTVSLAAVFIPVVFMGGIVGRLLHEFAVTIVIAIAFSGVISVTLTPMLCAYMLKDEHNQAHNAFYRWSENTFNVLHNGYNRSLAWSLAHRPIILGLFFASIFASAGLFMIMQEDFLPSDDQGRLTGQIQAANGTSFTQMYAYLDEVGKVLDADPNVTDSPVMMPSANGSAGSNQGLLRIVPLKPVSARASCTAFHLFPCHMSADDVARELRTKLSRFPGINVFVANPPSISIGGRGGRSTYQYTMQGTDLDQLKDVSDRLVAYLKDLPAFVGVNSDLDAAMPSVHVAIDRDRAAALGVPPQNIETALGDAFGGQQISQINRPANQYEVLLELLPSFQEKATSLDRLYVTTNTGTLVPLSAVTTVTQGTQPLSINHSGEIPSVTISFDLTKGYTLSDAVTAMGRATQDVGVPDTISGSFQGTAAAFQQSTQNMGMLLIVAMIVVYIILGILYESLIHPLTILSGLPSAAMGALLILFLVGLPLTLYAFVGMIMLIGIVKKNAIMMIDFALQRRRDDNIPALQAIHEAAMVRFRPIMMTTMAAMMGTLPIALGMGAGAESRRPLGLCVAGGLLFSQVLTLYITPVIYVYLDRLEGRLYSVRRKTKSAAAGQAAE
jgi:hydrophobic/amphiphilic exporter-1 (mainly G- bacteria), HAE1 family